MYDQSAAENGGLSHYGGLGSSGTRSKLAPKRKHGMSSLRLMLISIAALVVRTQRGLAIACARWHSNASSHKQWRKWAHRHAERHYLISMQLLLACEQSTPLLCIAYSSHSLWRAKLTTCGAVTAATAAAMNA